MKSCLLILLVLALVASGRTFAQTPRAPVKMALDSEAIQPLALHPAVNLLLVFPEPVTLITGQGLTTGEVPGQVQFQQGKENPKIVTLRLLDPKAQVLMQVVLQEQVFVFRLASSDKPLTVVRFFLDPEQEGQRQILEAREISRKEAEAKQQEPTEDRLMQMADLVGKEPHLRRKLPQAYSGYESREVDFSSPTVKGVTLQVHRVARFSEEDTLIFFGSLHNKGRKTIYFRHLRPTVQVGSDHRFAHTSMGHHGKRLAAGETTFMCVILVGNGEGEPLHLSLKNRFSIQLNL